MKNILTACLILASCCMGLTARAQDDNKEIGPNDFILLEKEPVPVNLDDLKRAIGYPAAALDSEIQGKVIVRMKINEQGMYMSHVVIKDPHPVLTHAVSAKLSMLRFTPGIQKGRPIKVWVTIPFDFKLTGGGEDKLPPGTTTKFYSLEDALAAPDPGHVRALYLNGKGLVSFPPEILKFSQLEILELGGNQLSSIPVDINRLSHLHVLGLSMNRFTAIPPEVLAMPSLRHVNISRNQLDKRQQKALEKEFAVKLHPKDSRGRVVW